MIVFTDPHGHYKTFKALWNQIPEEEKAKGVVFGGDLIDRGSGSREMIQFCIDNNILVVMGNHEEMMIREGLKAYEYFVKDEAFSYRRSGHNDIWGMNGGVDTLKSYIDIKEVDGKEKKVFDHKTFLMHLEWLKTLPYFLEFKDVKNEKGQSLLVTHSSAYGVWHWNEEKREKYKSDFQSHLIWNRNPQINEIEGVFNVFGHTPIHNGPKIKSCYANIDTGCFYLEEPGYGTLTALQYPEMIIYQEKNTEKE